MKKILPLCLAALLIATLFSGCSVIDSLTGKKTSQLATATGADTVHKVITAKDASSSYTGYETTARTYADYMNLVSSSGYTEIEEIQEQVNSQFITDAFVLAMVEEHGLKIEDDDKAFMQEQKDNMINDLKTQRNLSMDDYLLSIGVTESTLNYALEMQVLYEKVYAVLLDEDELMAYFEENFVTVEHVLIKTVDDQRVPFTDEEKLAEIERNKNIVMEKARAGEDFSELVKTYGEDDGVTIAPYHYTFTYGKMVPEFEETSFAMQPGEISDPVKTEFGYHIIKKLPIKAEYLNEVYDQYTGITIREFITDQLIGTKMDELRAEWEETVDMNFDAVLTLSAELFEKDKPLIDAARAKMEPETNAEPAVG